MKRIGIVLAIALLGAGLAQGQYGYQYVSGGYWFGAQFIGQEGWMAGTKGQVAHTKDGGKTWLVQTVPFVYVYFPLVPPSLSGISFTDQRHGWVCAEDYSPYLWSTTNGGSTWQPESIPNSPWRWPATGVSFVDSLQGWMIEGWSYWNSNYGRILKSSDGGRSWVVQDTSQSIGWNGVQALTPQKCWIAGTGGWIAQTTNGGLTWNQQQVPPLKTLYNIYFSDSLSGWACGDSGTIVHTSNGGASWAQQATGTMREILAIAFLDISRGFVVGDSGTLLRTSDGGATWTQISTGVSADLATITFGDSLHGWAIGEGGTTLETSDGGLTWQVTRQGTTDRLQAVSFVDDQTGWASSWEGNIWATQDGGKNWSKQAAVSPKRLRGFVMTNANTGWAVGDSGLVLSTRNGGASWIPQTSGTGRNLWNVFASDAQYAWGCGAGRTVVQTSNGGETWNTFSVSWPDSGITGLASFDTLYGWALFKDGNVWATTNSGRTWGLRGKIGSMGWQHISFVDPQRGWAVGDSGIVRSTDGGRTWLAQGPAYRMRDVAGGSRTKAWAVGDSGRILATPDGGTTWMPQNSNTLFNLSAVSFADTLRGIAGGEWNTGLVTRNGGATWDTVRMSSFTIKDVYLVDSLFGWAVGTNYIQRTLDGGYTWETMNNHPNPVAVHFADRDTGWVATDQYTIKTTEGGNSWTILPGVLASDIRLMNGRVGWCGTPKNSSNPSRLKMTFDGGNQWFVLGTAGFRGTSFKAGTHANTTTGCFVGSGAVALRVINAFTWDLAPLKADSLYPFYIPVLWGLDFEDARTGWAVGREGGVMITTDAGLNWRLQKRAGWLSNDSLLVSIQAFDALTARAVGYAGQSMLTTDGGVTWVREQEGTYEWLLASSFLTPTLGWVVGENGMVLKYGRLPYGVEEEKGKPTIPWETSLAQNRPNPFTGGTEIKYQLSSKGKVKLVVYNVLGQAVRRVVDKEQEPGAYGATWDGRDEAGRSASSGVYFYRLEASGKSQTKKMVKVR